MLVLGTAYIGAVYGEEELMLVFVLAEIVCLLVDVLLILKNTGEIGILLAEIRQAAEDEAVWEEPMLKRSLCLSKVRRDADGYPENEEGERGKAAQERADEGGSDHQCLP